MGVGRETAGADSGSVPGKEPFRLLLDLGLGALGAGLSRIFFVRRWLVGQGARLGGARVVVSVG